MYVHKMHTVQSYCAQLTGTDRIITNIGINFQYKVHIQFQELTKYQWKKKHNLESTKSMKCYCNSQHNTAPVHCSCGAQQSTQYSTGTLQLWRTTVNTIQHWYTAVVAHNSQHNTAPVHCSCGAQQSTQYSTSTLQLWRTTVNTIQHQYTAVVAHNSQHNTAPVHFSCGTQQSTQYSTGTLQLWRTRANTIQHQYISVVAHNSQHNTAPVHFSCGAQQQPTSLKFYTLNYLCSCKLMYWKNKTLWNLSYIVMQKEICCIISLFPQNAIYFTTLSPSVQVIRPS